jgi:hypothetical protein
MKQQFEDVRYFLRNTKKFWGAAPSEVRLPANYAVFDLFDYTTLIRGARLKVDNEVIKWK